MNLERLRAGESLEGVWWKPGSERGEQSRGLGAPVQAARPGPPQPSADASVPCRPDSRRDPAATGG